MLTASDGAGRRLRARQAIAADGGGHDRAIMNGFDDTTLRQAFREQRPLYCGYTERMADLIRALLADYGIRVQTVECRTKAEDAFVEKVYREGKAYGDPLAEITDISGIRVIAYYTRDVEDIAEILGREFLVDSDNTVDKSEVLGEDRFGYQSIHYIVQLTAERAELTEWHRFAGLKAEVQLRTVLQHAWAAINHSLTYKSQDDVPSPLRRRLHRISALLEAADAEFEDLKAALGAARDVPDPDTEDLAPQPAEPHHEPESPLPVAPVRAADEPLTAELLEAYVVSGDLARRWDQYAEEAGFQPVSAENAIAMARDNLLGFLRVAGVTTIAQMDAMVAAIEPEAPRLFAEIRRDWQVMRQTDRPPGAVCFAMLRIALLFALPPERAHELLSVAPFGPVMNEIIVGRIGAWSGQGPAYAEGAHASPTAA